jgi:hypothetical protein
MAQNKKQALAWDQLSKLTQGSENYRRTWPAKNYFASWRELWHKQAQSQLSKTADRLRYHLIYSNWINEDVKGLKNDLNNERRPSSSRYASANRLVQLMQKNGMTPKDFVLSIREKWQIIAAADRHTVSVQQIKQALDQGHAAELKRGTNPEWARQNAMRNIEYKLDFYDHAENLTEAAAGRTVLKDFLKFAVDRLKLSRLPKIQFRAKPSPANAATFGYFDPETDEIVIVLSNRHPMDIMRTLAHELVHYLQRMRDQLHAHSGETGSDQENQANAVAGALMRQFGRKHAEYFAESTI